MPILLSHPIGNPERGTRETWERQLAAHVRDALGTNVQISLPQHVLDQLRQLARAPASPARDGLRERGAAFAPCFQIVVADRAPGGSADWRLATQRSLAQALLPSPGSPSAPAGASMDDVAITLGFSITLPELIVFGSLAAQDGTRPHLTFNVLAPQSATGRLSAPLIRKSGEALSVILPEGRAVSVPPALAGALRDYLGLASGIPA